MSSFFNWIGGKINSVANTVSSAIGTIFKTVKNGISKTADTVMHAVGTVYQDAKSGLGRVYGDASSGASTVFKSGTQLISSVESDTLGSHGIVNNTVGSLSGIISMPLLLVGGGVAAFLLFSGKNSSVNASYSR